MSVAYFIGGMAIDAIIVKQFSTFFILALTTIIEEEESEGK